MAFDKEKFSKDFGQHLQDIREGRKLRKGGKISLRRLEQISDVDFSQIHRIEKGESSPSLVTLKALAIALEISLTDLINFEK